MSEPHPLPQNEPTEEEADDFMHGTFPEPPESNDPPPPRSHPDPVGERIIIGILLTGAVSVPIYLFVVILRWLWS